MSFVLVMLSSVPRGVLYFLFLCSLAKTPAAELLVLRNATVIDLTANRVRPGLSILVQKDRIAGLAPSKGGPIKGVDLRGKYVIPGLWDMHVHLGEDRPFFNLYVANGVLGLRDMGSDWTRTSAWRREVEQGRRLGPRLITSGPALDGAKDAEGKGAVVTVSSAAEGGRAVDALPPVDFAAVLSGLSRDAYIAIAQRSRLMRLPFAGPVPDDVSYEDAIRARQRSMEQLLGLDLASSNQESLFRTELAEARARQDQAAMARIRERIGASYDPAKAAALYELFKRFNVWQTPSLTVWRSLAREADVRSLDASGLQHIPDKVRSSWPPPEAGPSRPELLRYAMERTLAMQRAGVPLLAGTGAGDPWTVPGFALHDELALLVRAGLTPLEALRTATVEPARYLNLESQTGEIQAGKWADLVVLDANPLEDITAIRRVYGVVVRGRWLDKEALGRLLEEDKN